MIVFELYFMGKQAGKVELFHRVVEQRTEGSPEE